MPVPTPTSSTRPGGQLVQHPDRGAAGGMVEQRRRGAVVDRRPARIGRDDMGAVDLGDAVAIVAHARLHEPRPSSSFIALACSDCACTAAGATSRRSASSASRCPLGALDEAAAEHARARPVAVVEDASLARRDAGLAVGQVDDSLVAAARAAAAGSGGRVERTRANTSMPSGGSSRSARRRASSRRADGACASPAPRAGRR